MSKVINKIFRFRSYIDVHFLFSLTKIRIIIKGKFWDFVTKSSRTRF